MLTISWLTVCRHCMQRVIKVPDLSGRRAGLKMPGLLLPIQPQLSLPACVVSSCYKCLRSQCQASAVANDNSTTHQIRVHALILARHPLSFDWCCLQELVALNQPKIHEKWRTLMRKAKSEDLKRELQWLSDVHTQAMQRKDALIQVQNPEIG